jgi:hypothetical protein
MAVTDSLSVPCLTAANATSIWRQEKDMAPKPDRLALIFGMVLAMAVVTTWAAPLNAAPLNPESEVEGFSPRLSFSDR